MNSNSCYMCDVIGLTLGKWVVAGSCAGCGGSGLGAVTQSVEHSENEASRPSQSPFQITCNNSRGNVNVCVSTKGDVHYSLSMGMGCTNLRENLFVMPEHSGFK